MGPIKQNHLISRAGRLSFSRQLKPKKLCHHFLILATAKFQKISSVTVFTEVVAMISSFHRLSEKKNERKIMRTNYNCSIYKHPIFFGIVKQLNYFLKEKIENIYESAKKKKKKKKNIRVKKKKKKKKKKK